MPIKYLIKNANIFVYAVYTGISTALFPLDFTIYTIMIGGLLCLFKNQAIMKSYYPKRWKFTYILLLYEILISPIISYCNNFNLTWMVPKWLIILLIFLIISGTDFINKTAENAVKEREVS